MLVVVHCRASHWRHVAKFNFQEEIKSFAYASVAMIYVVAHSVFILKNMIDFKEIG